MGNETRRDFIKTSAVAAAGVAAVAEHGFAVSALCDAKKTLVNKSVLPRTQQKHFQRVQRAPASTDTKWRIQLPNGVSVEFSGRVDGGSLPSVLTTVAGLN